MKKNFVQIFLSKARTMKNYDEFHELQKLGSFKVSKFFAFYQKHSNLFLSEHES